MSSRPQSFSRLISLFFVGGVCLASCDDAEPRAALGEFCSESAACASGLCLDNFCSAACETDAQCTAERIPFACGVAADGSHRCVPACGAGGTYVCEAGKPVHCSQAQADACGTCGCPSAGTYCNSATDSCVPLEPVGDACEFDSQCESNNCSPLTRVCRVPIGAACTAANCDVCQSRSGGGTYCSAECNGPSDCDGDPCIGNSSIDLYYCAATCSATNTSACPGQCELTSDYSTYFCDCDGPECTETYAKAGIGAGCRGNSMCQSNDCWSVVDREWAGYTRTIGWCTQTCASDAGCTADTACVTVDCGSPSGCRSVCLPRCTGPLDCDRGTCAATPNATGSGSTSICSLKLANGAECYYDLDCQSGNCNQFGYCE